MPVFISWFLLNVTVVIKSFLLYFDSPGPPYLSGEAGEQTCGTSRDWLRHLSIKGNVPNTNLSVILLYESV